MASGPRKLLSPNWLIVEEDPLNANLQYERHEIIANLIGTAMEGETAINYLKTFQDAICRRNPQQLITLFPDREFTALSVIEYMLYFVIVLMDDPGELMSIMEQMDRLKSIISTLKIFLKKSSLYDEEQAVRVDASYGVIANAIEHCQQPGGNEGSGDDTKVDSNSWPPFSSISFSTAEESIFITSLRDIYIAGKRDPTGGVFESLFNLLRSTDLSHVTSSDIRTSIAIQLIFSIVKKQTYSDCCYEMNFSVYACFFASICTLNYTCVPKTPIPASFEYLLNLRYVFSRNVFLAALGKTNQSEAFEFSGTFNALFPKKGTSHSNFSMCDILQSSCL